METAAADLVRKARLRAGMSQSDLARRSGVARPVVWAIEHGERQPSLPTLAKVLRGAGVELLLDIVPLADVLVDPLRGDPGSEQRHARRVRDALELADTIRRAKCVERQATR